MGGKELKWRQLKTISYLAHNNLILVHAVQHIPTIKVHMSGRMASIGISDVQLQYSYSEKTHMKKSMMMMMKMTIIIIIIIIIMNKNRKK